MTDNNKQLTVQERAVAALGLAEIKGKLTDLAKSTLSLVEVTNEDSYKQIHSARMVLKNQRLDISKKGKAARDDANAFSKALIAEEKLLIEIIQPEEDRLHELQKDHDERAERERQEKIAAEAERVEAIQERITELRGAISAVNSMGLPSAEKVSEFISDVEKITVDSSFDEFEQQASEAKASTLALLRETLTAAQDRETEAKRVEAERAELAELRAADEKRQREEQEKREAEEAEAKKQREAKEANNRKILADKQAVIDAEEKRLAEERAEFEREKAEKEEADRKAEEAKQAEIDKARKDKEEAEALAKRSEYPGDEAVVRALSVHFDVPTEVATAWLDQFRQAA